MKEAMQHDKLAGSFEQRQFTGDFVGWNRPLHAAQGTAESPRWRLGASRLGPSGRTVVVAAPWRCTCSANREAMRGKKGAFIFFAIPSSVGFTELQNFGPHGEIRVGVPRRQESKSM